MEEIVVKLGSAGDAPVQDILKPQERTEEALTSLHREIEELRGLNKKYRDENETLRERINTIEEDVSPQVEAAKEGEPQILYLDRKIQKLEERIAALKERSDLSVKQAQLIGELPLTRGIKLANAPGQLAITECISGDIPEEKQRAGKSQPVLTKPTRLSSAQLSFAAIPRLSKMEILKRGANGAQHIRHGQSFGIRLSFGTAKPHLPDTEPLEHKTVIYATSLKDHRREIIAETQNLVTLVEMKVIDIEARVSSPGMHRLQAAVTFARPEGGSAPHAASLDGGIFYVY